MGGKGNKKNSNSSVPAAAAVVSAPPATTTSAATASVPVAKKSPTFRIPKNVTTWCRATLVSPANSAFAEKASTSSTKDEAVCLVIFGTASGDLVAGVSVGGAPLTSVLHIHGAHSGAVRALALSAGPFEAGHGASLPTSVASSSPISADTLLASGGIDGSVVVVPLLAYLEAALQPSLTTTTLLGNAASLLRSNASAPKCIRLGNTHHLPITGVSFLGGVCAIGAGVVVASVSLDGRLGIHRISFPTLTASSPVQDAKAKVDQQQSGSSSIVNASSGSSKFVSVGFPLTALYDPLVSASSTSSTHFLAGAGGPVVLVVGTKVALVDTSALLVVEESSDQKQQQLHSLGSEMNSSSTIISKAADFTVVGGAVVAPGSVRAREMFLPDAPLRTKPPVGNAGSILHMLGAGSDLAVSHVPRYGGRCVFLGWFPQHSAASTDLPTHVLPSGSFCTGPIMVVDVPRDSKHPHCHHSMADSAGGGATPTLAPITQMLLVGVVVNGEQNHQQQQQTRHYIQFSLEDVARAAAAFKLPSTVTGVDGNEQSAGGAGLNSSEGTFVTLSDAALKALVEEAAALTAQAAQQRVAREQKRHAAAHRAAQLQQAEEEEERNNNDGSGESTSTVAAKVEIIRRRLANTPNELYSLDDNNPAAVAPTSPSVAGAKRPREDESAGDSNNTEEDRFRTASEVDRAAHIARMYLQSLRTESETLYRELAAKKAAAGNGKRGSKKSVAA